MMDSRGKAVGRYVMRLSLVFIGGGVFLLKRSGPDRRTDSVPGAAR